MVQEGHLRVACSFRLRLRPLSSRSNHGPCYNADCNRVRNRLLVLSTRKPVLGRQCDIPHVTGNFKLDPNVVERAVSLRTPYPNDACRHNSRQPTRIPVANFQHDGGIRRRITDALILAAVAIGHHCLRCFPEQLAERVGSPDGDRGGMLYPRAAALLCATPV